ncbi:hypothetical protein ACFL2H_06475, partial [Planctomycetota bacterium]
MIAIADSINSPKAPRRRVHWRRLFQFRLSTILILVTICAIAIGYRKNIRHEYQTRQVIIEYLRDTGATVRLIPKRPRLLARFIGQDLYRDVVSIDFQHLRIRDEDLGLLRGIDGCERLYLANTLITDDGLAHIAHFKNLKRISLWKTKATNRGLKHLAGMSDLEAIDLDHTKVDNEGLRLLKDLKNLRELSLSDWMSDRGLAHLSGLKNLRELNINRAAVSHVGLAHLSDSKLQKVEADSYYVLNSRLKELLRLPHLKYMAKVSATTDEEVAMVCERLRPIQLSLTGRDVTDRSISHLLKLKGQGLVLISVRDTSMSGKGYRKLQSGLGKTITVSNRSGGPNAGFRETTNAAGKVSVVVGGSRMTVKKRHAIGTAWKASSFYIHNAELNEEFLSLFTEFHQFEFMYIQESDFTSSNLATIQQLQRLRLVDVTLTADVIDALARLPKLERITMERCLMPDDAVARFSKSKTLREFGINGRAGLRVPLPDQHMDDLRRMTQIESLDLSSTDFNDGGCVALKNLINLHKLNLAGTFITGKSRPILEELSNLEEIKVSSRMARVQAENANGN